MGSGNGLAADHKAELNCSAWYSGRLVGYIYWATAPENDIRVCVQDHGANITRHPPDDRLVRFKICAILGRMQDRPLANSVDSLP